jgi:hypothetical protein
MISNKYWKRIKEKDQDQKIYKEKKELEFLNT